MFLTRRHTSGDELARLQNEVSRMFDGVLGPAVGFWPAVATNRPAVAWPKLDVSETDSAIHVSAELPGVKQEEIDIEVHADTLRISGEKKDDHLVNSSGQSHCRRKSTASRLKPRSRTEFWLSTCQS